MTPCALRSCYRHNPQIEAQGKNPLVIDSKDPSVSFDEYAYHENRYRALRASNPEVAAALMKQAEAEIQRRWKNTQAPGCLVACVMYEEPQGHKEHEEVCSNRVIRRRER